jgi:hypothetical protein
MNTLNRNIKIGTSADVGEVPSAWQPRALHIPQLERKHGYDTYRNEAYGVVDVIDVAGGLTRSIRL